LYLVFLKPEDVILPTQIYYAADFGNIVLRKGEEKFLVYGIKNIEICQISQSRKESNSKTYINRDNKYRSER
jgi:hypothetical protein